MDLGHICHLPSVNFIRRQTEEIIIFDFVAIYDSVSKIKPARSKTVCKMGCKREKVGERSGCPPPKHTPDWSPNESLKKPFLPHQANNKGYP